jgi:tetratricopeptide (TPR) repeat protein
MSYHNEEIPNKPADEEAVVLATVADPGERSSASPPNRWLGRLFILATIVLVLGPVTYIGLPAEIARWYVAAAIEKRLEGDTAGALADLQAALSWAPDNATVFTQRGDWNLQDGRYLESLEDYNRALQHEPGDAWALVQRSQALQHLQRHKEAIADWKKLVQLHEYATSGRRAMYLNGLAYAQALGNTELDSALENIEQALNLRGQNAAMLDTRGFIHYLRGEYTPAGSDLEVAVQEVEDELREFEQSSLYVDRREYERQLEEVRKSVAVIRYHRALLNDQLNKAEAAAADRQRVRELGFEPNEGLF